MSDFYIFRLDVGGKRTHIGSDVAGIGVENVSEFVHSDTLFSAICNGWSEVFGKADTDNMLGYFVNNDSPFKISSAFLCVKGLYYLPKPLLPLPGSDSQDDKIKILINKFGNKISSAKFIHFDDVKKWLSIDENSTFEFYEKLYESILEGIENYRKGFVKIVRPVNVRSRFEPKTQVYHRGEVVYEEDKTWLYFLVEFIKEGYISKLKNVIEYISDFGAMGGERNIGFGEFSLKQDYCIKTGQRWTDLLGGSNSKQRKGSYLLSLYFPHPYNDNIKSIVNVDNEHLYYDLIFRRGWFHSLSNHQYKRKTVRMFSEGSILPADYLNGKIVCVSPEEWKKKDSEELYHPIYRYGIAFVAPKY